MVVHLEVFTTRATQCVAPTRIYRTHRTGARPLVPVSFLCRGVRGGCGRHSWSMVVHLEVFTTRATQCVAPTRIYRTHRTGARPLVPVSFLCRGVRGGCGRHSWSMVVHLEVFTTRATQCVAPTRIYRTHRTGARPLVLVAFLCRGVRGGGGRHSWSTVVHLEVFTTRATQCVAPTRIYRTHRTGARPLVPVAFLLCCPRWRRVDPDGWAAITPRPAKPRIYRTHRAWTRPLVPVSFLCRGVRGGGGRHSWSTVVHLEVFTTRATHASPLHGFIERTARGRSHCYPLRFSAGASGVVAVDIRGQWWFTWRCLRHGRRSASPLHGFIERTARGRSHWCPFRSFCAVRGWWRSTFVVDGGSPGGVYDTGDAVRRPYTDLSNAPHGGASIGTRCVPFVLSGVVAVDIRGQWWFTWRCLRHGRRSASPSS